MDEGLCGICGLWGAYLPACAACGHSSSVARVRAGGIVEVPPGSLPCSVCGTLDEPIVFRAWVRVYAFFLFAWERRGGGYVCRRCARRQTAASLWLVGLFGWWGISAFLFYAPRAVYHNWRSVWLPPAHPLSWGAASASVIQSEIRNAQAAADEAAVTEVVEGSPLAPLNGAEREAVLAAEGLYELIGTARGASATELRRAYTACAKEHHPDLRPGQPAAGDDMARLNHAWSILRDDRMRVAYDWLEARREGAVM